MNAAARLIEVRVPDMGNFKDVAIIDVLVKPGESIEPEAPLVTLETEKATMDVPSTVGGVVEKVHVAKGGTVSTGDLVATVRSDAAPGAASEGDGAKAEAQGATAKPAEATKPPTERPAARDTNAAKPDSAPQSSKAAPGAQAKATAGADSGERTDATPPANTPPPINEPGFARAHAGPSVRKFARELGVDLTQVKGGGFKGRVTHEDVKAFVKQFLSGGAPAARGGAVLPAIPSIDFAQFGPIETQPLSRIQKISGPRLHASWVNIPHVTQFDEADITDLEDTRNRLKDAAAKRGIKLTPLAFVLRACVKTLQEFPVVNASLDVSGNNLILKKYIHLGFAADTPNGLVVPVVRDADGKDIYELARHLGELSGKARAGKLTPGEMQGASFTISSLGGIGGTAFTPIINAPEVAILGVSRSLMKPVFRDGQFVPRLILPLSFSYDHRVIDGATAVRFTTFLVQTLGDARGLAEAVP